MGKKKEQKRLDPELEQEISEWGEYLLADLRDRIKKNKGKMLSERGLKKTSNGDATYERLVRVIGHGSPERLRQIVAKMVQEVQGVQETQETQETWENFEDLEHFESEKHFEEPRHFEPEKHFEGAERCEVIECLEAAEVRESDVSRELSRSAGRVKRQKWDKASLIAFLQEKCRELGRVPTSKEIAVWSKAKLCPSYPTCMKILEVESKAEWAKIFL